MKILLVDDEHDLVSTLAERMSFRGIDADWVSNGEDALAKLQNTTYDIAVLDMKMPHMSGLELREKIHAIHPKIKFIFMTGHGSAEDFNNATSAEGSDCYLIKPVNINLLIEKITTILEG
ncbi:MAG: response regulator [Thermodesulfobacteriota bacterium]|nr:response regulator [Thermodesulfobacteriota bacterium]